MLDIQLHVTGKYFPGRPISRRESGDLPFSKQQCQTFGIKVYVW